MICDYKGYLGTRNVTETIDYINKIKYNGEKWLLDGFIKGVDMMLNMREKDINFIQNNLDNAEKLLATKEVNDILDALYDWIEDNGYSAESEYLEYNDLGREAQDVYDSVYARN
ncbi:MAG: hypothetical protein ACOX1S_05200 [Anaerostipes sp.]